MAKHIKAWFYGPVGIGKSTFVGFAPKPFYFCTDGNYEYLEGMIPDFDEANHVVISSWTQFKQALANPALNNYDTLVVDLLEDVYSLCEREFIVKNRLQSLGDMEWGRGYGIVRDDFKSAINQLLALPKNVILLSHEVVSEKKDKRGVTFTTFAPKIADALLDPIEGRVQYALRVFGLTEENADKKLVTNRYLSLSPDGTLEWGVARNIDMDTVPRYIPLDWDTFVNVIETHRPTRFNIAPKVEKPVTPVAQPQAVPVNATQSEEKKQAINNMFKKPTPAQPSVLNNIVNKVETPVVEVVNEPVVEEVVVETPVVEAVVEPVVETPVVKEAPKTVAPTQKPVTPTAKPAVAPAQPATAKSATTSQEDKIAAIKAKLAAMNASK